MNRMRDRLVEKLKKHDEKALTQIIEQQSRLVASIIFNTSKGSLSKEDIEEVTSDVFVTLWNNAEKVQEGKLKGYICSIAKTRYAVSAILPFRRQQNADDLSVYDRCIRVGRQLAGRQDDLCQQAVPCEQSNQRVSLRQATGYDGSDL